MYMYMYIHVCTMLHWPADGQFQLLKDAEEDQVLTEVIRALFVGWILWGSPTQWTYVLVGGKEKLLTSIPTVFQQHIMGNLLNAERIRSDNKDGLLHTTKLNIKIKSNNYIYEHCIYHYIHNMHMYVHVCIYHVCKYLFSICTLPLDTRKKCFGISNG